jgi:methanogenic corrinoid protein MtbC1
LQEAIARVCMFLFRDLTSVIGGFNPDVVDISALTTTTMINQRRDIDELKRRSLRGRVKIIIGRVSTSEEWILEIDADTWGLIALMLLKSWGVIRE